MRVWHGVLVARGSDCGCGWKVLPSSRVSAGVLLMAGRCRGVAWGVADCA